MSPLDPHHIWYQLWIKFAIPGIFHHFLNEESCYTGYNLVMNIIRYIIKHIFPTSAVTFYEKRDLFCSSIGQIQHRKGLKKRVGYGECHKNWIEPHIHHWLWLLKFPVSEIFHEYLCYVFFFLHSITLVISSICFTRQSDSSSC